MLEINNNHKKANLNKLKKPLKTMAITISIPVVMFVYSGSNLEYNVYAEKETIKSEQQSKTIVPDSCYWDVLECIDSTKDGITKKDLEKVKKLFFYIDKKDSLEFLKYCDNLEHLTIGCKDSDTTVLKTMPKLKNLKYIRVLTYDNTGIITDDFSKFFKNIDGVEEFEISGPSLGPNTVEQLKDVETLSFTGSKNVDIDYSKLKIKTLDLSECGTYNIPFILDNKTYKKLPDYGIKVKFDSEKQKQKYLDISKRLDDIVKKLDIKKTDNDKEKLDKVLIYVLSSLTYDERVDTEKDPGEDYFYKDGDLYGALERKTSICGNYAALTKALLEKAGVETYYASSSFHAFNLVKVEGKLYCLDSTWIDGSNNIKAKIPVVNENNEIISYKNGTENDKVIQEIEDGLGPNYEWYLTDPSLDNMKELDPDGNHNYVGFPTYMEEDLKESGSLELDVSIGDKKVTTSLGALIGAFTVFGGSRLVKKSAKAKNNNRRRV